MSMKQKEIFLNVEGDNFHERNKARLSELDSLAKNDPVLKNLKQLEVEPTSVLEIGCGEGWRLEIIRREYAAKCYGVEPSAKAVSAGLELFPDLLLKTGTADSLPYDNAAFDLVIFGFCLYLVDRSDLFKVAAEADRVLAEKGQLAIFDFHSPFPYYNDYCHLPGLRAFKMNYSKMFLWHPAYTLQSQLLSSHNGNMQIDNTDERVSVLLLRKSNEFSYPKNPFVAK